MRTFILMVAVILSGCASTKTVYVPVSSCPEPPAVTMPLLMVDSLPNPATTEQVLKSLTEDYVVMKNQLRRLLIMLDAYRNKPNLN